MIYQRFWGPRNRVFLAGMLFLVFILACGGSATSTPLQPTATTVAPVTGSGTPTAVPTATPPPAAAGEPVVNRLVVAAVFEREVNDPHGVGAPLSFQWAPMYEGMTRMALDGEFKVLLAESWEVSPDLLTWTFRLREGVQWHKGFGEFTAQDVLNSDIHHQLPGTVSSRAPVFKKWVEEGRIVVVDDYTITYNLDFPRIDLTAWGLNDGLYGAYLSKAHWDAEGQDGIRDNPIGTGPYQYVERVLGSHVLYERVPYEHWRSTPDFPELMLAIVPEHATRLAMLLAEEAHIAMVPRDLQTTALANGMRVIEASIPTVPVYTMFGGNFLDHPTGQRKETKPDLPWSDVFHPVTEVPWVHKKVRQALNMAVNREELQRTLFHGQGDLMPVAFYHSSLPGWNQEWMDNFQEDYGYNPDRARELLAEVEAEIGQPLDWSKMRFALTIRAELPELIDTGEAIQNYWRDIGAEVKIEVLEFATFREHLLDNSLGGVAWTDATVRFLDPRIVEVIYYSKYTCCNFFERDFIDENYEILRAEPDLAKRDQLLRKIGNFLHDEYATLPLFWFSAAFTVNPEVVADYASPGNLPPRDLENVVAVRK